VTHERCRNDLLFLPELRLKYILLVTSGEEIHLRTGSSGGMTIKANSKDNMKDVHDYLDRFISSPKISIALGLNSEPAKQKFVSTHEEKSEGNFICTTSCPICCGRRRRKPS
jgi:hypothetical protein